jgi:DNA-binding XRE family transcriptional regulator
MATNKNGTKYEEFEAELLKKPEIRREYDALEPKYNMIRCLIERRNQLRISQTRLAKLTGMQQPAICRLEKGDYNTTLSTFFKVTNALGLDISLKAKADIKDSGERVHV